MSSNILNTLQSGYCETVTGDEEGSTYITDDDDMEGSAGEKLETHSAISSHQIRG